MRILCIPFAMALVSAPAAGQDTPTAIYQQYEHAYLANDSEEMAHWLKPDADLSETLHVGDKSETRRMPSTQLLDAMRRTGHAAKLPASPPDKIVISDTTNAGFCATAEASEQTVVGGQRYQERDVRKVCFVRGGQAYLVKSHSTDVFYTPAP